MAVLKQDAQNSSTVGYFKVQIPNPYAVAADLHSSSKLELERSLQIKILDVLYNDRICSLVYMHDITNVISGYKQQSNKVATILKKPSQEDILLIVTDPQ